MFKTILSNYLQVIDMRIRNEMGEDLINYYVERCNSMGLFKKLASRLIAGQTKIISATRILLLLKASSTGITCTKNC
jgi:hypothetical protein